MPVPDIHIVKIVPRGEVFQPSLGDPDGGINKTLTAVLKDQPAVPLASGKHRLVPYPATLPHAHGEHTVYWMDRVNGNTPAQWEEDSWRKVSQDSDFLSGIEQFVKEEQAKNPKLRFYFFIGFANGSEPIPNKHVYTRGLQSQRRGHIHGVELSSEVSGDILDPENPKHKNYLSLVLNQGGEHAIRMFDQQLKDVGYGERFLYTQTLGRERRVPIARTMFGFHSLQEALQKSLRLVDEIRANWTRYLEKLSGEHHEFENITLPIMQSCVPNIAFFFPSEEDKKNGGADNTFPVWTVPFSIASIQNMTIPGGIVTERG